MQHFNSECRIAALPCGGIYKGKPLTPIGRSTRASLGHKGLLRRDFYADFTAGDVRETGLMPDFSNDNLPSNNPSLKTVLIVLCSIGVVVTFIMYHSTFGL
jgi:hypothetical protein